MSTLRIYSNRHIKNEFQNVEKNDRIYLENKLSRKRWAIYFRDNDIDESKLNLTYITHEEFFELKNKQFDCIVGNPPYQDNSIKANQQNKIYNQFSKKALELLSPTGTLGFTTPVAVANLSKRFALTEIAGIKEIDFSADNDFNVGTKICSWIVDKNYQGDIKITDSNNNVLYSKTGISIFDPAVVDIDFALLSEKLLKLPIEDREFKQNNHGPAYNKTKTSEHIYPTYKVKDGELILSAYTKREPWFCGKLKMSISRSKSFREDIIQVSELDFETQYVTVEIDNDQQVENIKSFLFSDYFMAHMASWKKLWNTGFNDALKYVPPFDKNKQWTSEEVRELFENYAR